ncbi:conserved hypothetical protein [Leptothrix cholodnii SP-6]|uniref:Cytochrome c domain-containing protein n=1 Tax=Leptothrix cholodnii (strain ATCC 51168 / LMG 8142 / SP-6) TaxID=395495 RepID=B1Y5V7_LEPCP|nr:hypothetical protein [Leptothrix cholodnii]ACB36003.1 conserved hypothetical protein [Leptothrix cholodnii SP-6]
MIRFASSLRRLRNGALWLAAAAAVGAAAPAWSAGHGIFEGADLALGERLIRENQCDACHIRRVGGNGHGIYNPKGRISTPGALRGMVEYCSTELNLQLFPEEVTAVGAVLQRDHYRFK